MANSIAIAVLFARLAGPRPYGIYQLAFAVVAIAAIIALPGSGTAATRAAAQGRNAAWPLLRARLPFALAGALGIGIVAAGIAATGRGALGAAFAAAAVTFPFFVGADVYPASLIGARRFMMFLAFQLVVQTATALAVVVALVVSAGRPWVAVAAVAGLTGMLQLYGAIRHRATALVDANDVSYARRMSLVIALAAIDARLDVVVSAALLGTRQAGIVAVARTPPTAVKRIWEVLYQPFFVKMSTLTRRDAFGVARRYRVPLVGALGGVSVVAALATPWVLPAVFGHRFQGAVPLTELLLLSTIVFFPGYLDEVFLRAQADLRRAQLIYLTLPVVSLIALPPLVYVLGIEGIGYEALLVAVVYVVLVSRLARRSVAEADDDM
jgi:O-antigen/teichoic acid export membrane protein